MKGLTMMHNLCTTKVLHWPSFNVTCSREAGVEVPDEFLHRRYYDETMLEKIAVAATKVLGEHYVQHMPALTTKYML